MATFRFPLFENDEQEGFKVTPRMIAATAKLKAEREKLKAREKAYRKSESEKHKGLD